MDPFDDGFFVFLYPKDNTYYSRATEAYSQCMTSHETFSTWILETVEDAIKNHTSDPWIDLFYDRYLSFDKLENM